MWDSHARYIRQISDIYQVRLSQIIHILPQLQFVNLCILIKR